MREVDIEYFEHLETRLDRAISIAETARERGEDPVPEVEIPVATDMADRVENILGIEGVAERVRELDAEHSRERAALMLVEDFVEGSVGDYDTKAGKVEGAVRTAVALLTEGVVAAPIEGIDRVSVEQNDDGTEFVSVAYAGPIRSAGGTAQALSVLVADYARSLLGMSPYKPRDDEVERYAEEVALYDKETGLQYTPSDDEAKHIARNVPIMLDGEATGENEVSGFRDLERVDTNRSRGGMCLVLAEGIALKAPKIQRYTDDLDDVEWPWLQALIDGAVGSDDGAEETTSEEAATEEVDGPPRVKPKGTFLRDLIAGRPVFSHPSEAGGFRLRYGRSRNLGHATAGVHPATMHLVDDFLATGTQIKTERPGKAAGVVPVDSIEGPTVKLANGDVRRIDDPSEALEVRNGVEAILDLGEYLVNYGEFVENNQPLAPAAYAFEWWVQDLAAAGANVQALEDSPYVDLERPDPDQALNWARDHDAPLHPEYTYLYHDLDVEHLVELAEGLADGRIEDGALHVPRSEPVRTALETLLVEHRQHESELVVPTWRPLVLTLGLTEGLELGWSMGDLSKSARDWDNAMKALEEVAPFEVRERAPTRIGNRMGRPEKSESRDLSPAVHTLFPIGDAGGNQRDVAKAAAAGDELDGTQGTVEVELGERECTACGARTYKPRCQECGEQTRPVYQCPDCSIRAEPDESGRVECPKCERELSNVGTRTVDLGREFSEALEAVSERATSLDIVKGVQGLMSRTKVPEPMEKGILRAKHGVTSFKDGTVRYDMTDLPVTAVRPNELDVTVGDFRELGYEEDINGEPLEHDDQLVELRVQDVVLSDGAAEHMLKTADFVDDLLTEYYGLNPFYDLEDREDLVGELVFGMAPHTSAAVVGRVVGFTSAAVGYAHPYFHASKRRNCDGDEDCVMLLMDGLLNFSKQYLPDSRGGSIAEDSRIITVDPDGNPRFMTVDSFWERLEAETIRDGKFRKKECLKEGWKTYVFDENQQSSLNPIEKAIRYQADAEESLVRVEAQFGRSIEVTEHHSLFRYDDGIEEVAGGDLEPGDLILAPRTLSLETTKTTLDLTEILDEPYTVIDDTIENLLRTAWEETERGSPTHRAFNGGLSRRLSKSKIAFDQLKEICNLAGIDLPSDILIGRWGSEGGIARTIEIDEEFGWLLGLFVAEGSTSTVNPTIHNGDEDIIDRAGSIVEDVLDIEPGRRWSNRAYELRFPSVFSDVLYNMGFEDIDSYSSSEKVIPDPILDAPQEVILAFLRGFIAGDGSDQSDDNVTTVSFYTTSEQVKDGIVFLLHRLGVVANISKRTERSGNRQDIYDITVSGGAEDNPLHRKLQNDDSYLPKSLVIGIPKPLMDLREMDIPGIKQTIPKYLRRRENISLEKLSEIITSLSKRDLSSGAESKLAELRNIVEGDLSYLRVKSVEQVDYDGYLYDLQVGGEPIFAANWLYAHNSMDAPLVMSSRIDPEEIDDEAHNIDTVDQYPRAFYEATREMADTDAVDIEIAEDHLGTDRAYSDFGFTHETSNIALGPDLSAYKTLGSMMEKMDAQLELARKLRAVDETDVAERVIEYHFLPDLIGNLRAFSRQEVRCLSCGKKYRRMPLTGNCRECGGDVNLTVHEGSVNKYLDTAIEVAEEYGSREYTKQRLQILQRSIESIFENDKNKQSGIADFM